ncbi:MAG: hypothetical protein IRZ21_12390 [Thermoleophilaceae bacterium]|nr:hypothetical protein [Thermoleophilaceae bacterium]
MTSLDYLILDAMRSGEWLRTQWIARVVFRLGDAPGPHLREYGLTLRELERLERAGVVERRTVPAERRDEVGGAPVRFELPRLEWRAVAARLGAE